MERGVVFNIQRFSVHDGPGIRTTVFLKGCPLACAWCHNPEGLSPGPEVVLSPNRCMTCGQCVDVCPQSLPTVGRAPELSDLDMCLACGACAEACPCEARQVAGHAMTVAEVVAEIVKDRIFFEESGGGVTFSGGEPLWQAGFLRATLQACRDLGIHTAVDTSGMAPLVDLLEVAQVTDLFLFDLKLVDDRDHRRYTGVSNRQIVANLRALASGDQRIWLRVPVIPGINDDEKNLAATADLAVALPGVERVCLLPYHPLGEDKLKRLGRASLLEDVQRPTTAHMRTLAALVESAGVAASVGG